jgi:hypothetical protein
MPQLKEPLHDLELALQITLGEWMRANLLAAPTRSLAAKRVASRNF